MSDISTCDQKDLQRLKIAPEGQKTGFCGLRRDIFEFQYQKLFWPQLFMPVNNNRYR